MSFERGSDSMLPRRKRVLYSILIAIFVANSIVYFQVFEWNVVTYVLFGIGLMLSTHAKETNSPGAKTLPFFIAALLLLSFLPDIFQLLGWVRGLLGMPHQAL
ncbi:MAG: hypothetical protein ACREM8_05185 [Vulcanimicrobiaceae bacterium]